MPRPRGSVNRNGKGKAENWCVYALCNPVSHEVMYVGTSSNLRIRYNAHVTFALNGSDYREKAKDKWIRDLTKKGLSPELVVLELVSRLKALNCERKWQMSLMNRGVKLLNDGVFGRIKTAEFAWAFGIRTEQCVALRAAAARFRDRKEFKMAAMCEKASEIKPHHFEAFGEVEESEIASA
jgi:hypothetical protein